MRRATLLVSVVALGGLAGLVTVPAHASHPADAPWVGEATMVSGTSTYDVGADEWIYTDFVYDDYGADTGSWGQPNLVGLAPTVGDARYPDGASYLDNAADIVEVRVRPVGDDLQVRVLLQTLVDPDVVALWVRADDDEQVITAAGSVIDTEANTVTFVLPGKAAADAVTLTVGAGLHDGEGGLRPGVAGNASTHPGELTTGGPTDNRLLDLAFNTAFVEGRGGAWNEDQQAKALAAGTLSDFAQTVHLDVLRQDLNVVSLAPGQYRVHLFESRQDLGEGVPEAFPQYRGKYQPYAVWLPDTLDPDVPTPLFLSLHSLEVHHNQFRGGPSPSASFRTYYEQMGDALGAIVVTPLGRGPDGWYEDEALVDTLEVWADIAARYPIDPERVYVGGYSMGGYGTYRLTTLMPEAFASAAVWVGPPANGIWAHPLPPPGGADDPGFTRPQLENTRHVPTWITQGVLDELVPVTGVQQQADRYAELGHQHRFSLHPAEDHLTFVFKDDWAREAGWLAAHPARVTEPHRITFKVRPASWATGGDPTILGHLTDLTAEVGARLDGAYWIGDVEVAGAASAADVTGVVDLTSGGIVRRRAGTADILTAGVDGPSPHRLTGTDVVWSEDQPVTPLLSGRLSGVSALTVDVGRAGLPDQPILDISSDIPVTFSFVRNGTVVGTTTFVPPSLG